MYKKGCYVELSNTTIYWPRSCRDICIPVLILQYAGENDKNQSFDVLMFKSYTHSFGMEAYFCIIGFLSNSGK